MTFSCKFDIWVRNRFPCIMLERKEEKEKKEAEEEEEEEDEKGEV